MNRTPPIEVRRTLRQQVGFGCPVPNCGNPYLEWHHFDPPWHVNQHHNPDGMIALCSQHHPQADAGAFTLDQLHEFKRNAVKSVGAKFDWLRHRLLATVGGNHFLETYEIFRLKGNRIIWFNRNEEGHLLLNLRPVREARLIMEENFWLTHGNLADLECPPSGRLIHAKYPNGDEFRIEFFECEDEASLRKCYPNAHRKVFEIETPITVVEVMYRVANTQIDFGPSYTLLPGIHIQNSFSNKSAAAFVID